MTELYAAFCDDDAAARAHMREAAEKCFAECGVTLYAAEYDTAEALLAAMSRGAFALLFLDIDMPEMDGIRLGERLRELGSEADIIYVSNMDERVYEVFPVRPWGFVRKSRFDVELGGVVERYVRERAACAPRIVIQDAQGAPHAIAPETLVYVESAGKLQKLFTSDGGQQTARCALRELEERLAGTGFIRVHKGFLVNYRFIRRIRSRGVELDDGRTLPVGRGRLDEVRERYLALMKWKGLAPAHAEAER